MKIEFKSRYDDMYIGDTWYTDAELTAHVMQLYNAVHLAAEIIQRYVDDTGIIDAELLYKIRDFEQYEKGLPL